MDILNGRLMLHKAGEREINTLSKDLWFNTLYWMEGGNLKPVNIYVSTYNRALSLQDETEDSLELTLRRTPNASDQLMIIWEAIKDHVYHIEFYDDPKVTRLALETQYTVDCEGKPVLGPLDIHVQSEDLETRIYPTLTQGPYHIGSSDPDRQVEVQNLRLEKHFQNLALLVSVREKTVIGQRTLVPELHLVMKTVENQDQAEDETLGETNSNLNKFKRERDALIQNHKNEHVIEFVADVIHGNKVIGFLMEYAKKGSLLANLKAAEEVKRTLTDDTRKQWVMQFFQGLASLHDEAYVVANIHPQNCLVDADDNLKISGLGRKHIKKDMPLPLVLSTALTQQKRLVPLTTRETDLYMAGLLAYMVLSRGVKLKEPTATEIANINNCPLQWKICVGNCIRSQTLSARKCVALLSGFYDKTSN